MSDLDKNMAVKSMVVMRKAFRTIDAKVSETFKEFNLTQPYPTVSYSKS